MHIGFSFVAAVVLVALAGCASRSAVVDRGMLLPEGVARVALQERQVFVMPVPIEDPDPVYPQDETRARAVSICASFIVSEMGEVRAIEQIDDMPGCAKAREDNAAFFAAVQSALERWSFIGAAICTFELTEEACDGTDAVLEAVPVRLAYRSGFRVENGRRRATSSSLD